MADEKQAPGKPGDAGKALLGALEDAAKEIAEPKADAAVLASVKLGWLLADLAAGRRVRGIDDAALDPAPSAMTQGHVLRALIADLAAPAEDAEDVLTALDGGQAPTAAVLQRWRAAFVAWAMATDLNRARGEDLGRMLSDLYAYARDAYPAPDPSAVPGSPVDRHLDDARVAPIIRRLDALSTALPAHVARGVANSLRRWSPATPWPGDVQPTRRDLITQIELWRRLIVGEKRAIELLEPENYLDAAERLSGKYVATAWLAIKQNKVIASIAGGLAAFGALVLIVVAFAGDGDGGGIGVGLSALLGSFGLTWKGLGGAVGELAARFEAPLWAAELDGAVTDAATLIEVRPPDRPSDERRDEIAGGDYAARGALAEGAVPA